MEKRKIKDYLIATKDEAICMALESDALPEIVTDIAGNVVSEGVAQIFGNVIGAVVPGINGIRLNYKQNSFEKRIIKALQIMAIRIEAMEENYCLLTEDMQEKFRGIYVEWLLDNLYNERQNEKVESHVNGFVNLMTNDANDNLMLMFFDTMNQLTQLDIDVLKMYSLDAQENIYELSNRYHLDPVQIGVIKEKLARLGLLYSRNDEQRDENIDEVVGYLIKVDKEAKKSKPQAVKLPHIKKVRRSESYSITSLGRSYLQVIKNE